MNPGGVVAKIIHQKGLDIAVVEVNGNGGWPSVLQAGNFIDSIKGLGDYDLLYALLDSSGGSPIDSWAIYDFLKTVSPRYGSLGLITGRCSADAIMIALAFNQILMLPHAYVEFCAVRRPRSASSSKFNGVLARLVAQRTGSGKEEVLRWIDKNKKLSATECLRLTLCDAIV
jgi:ATP-dependent protease ClpP protease subunit